MGAKKREATEFEPDGIHGIEFALMPYFHCDKLNIIRENYTMTVWQITMAQQQNRATEKMHEVNVFKRQRNPFKARMRLISDRRSIGCARFARNAGLNDWLNSKLEV